MTKDKERRMAMEIKALRMVVKQLLSVMPIFPRVASGLVGAEARYYEVISMAKGILNGSEELYEEDSKR